MKTKAAVCTLFFGLLLFAPGRAGALDAGDLIDYFVATLSPHGRWIDEPPYGRIWEPATYDPNWRPYSNGRWDYTDHYGWVWQPADSFGGVPYRYGRWFRRMGRWFWVPDRVWGPAWVDWRYSSDYVGWAPLPPDDGWRFDDYRSRSEWRPSYYRNRFEPDDYVCVPSRAFTAPDVRRYEVPVARKREILRRSQPISVYRRDNQDRVRNEGPRREAIERAAGRRIEPVRIEPKEVRPLDSRNQSAARWDQEKRARRQQQEQVARAVKPREPGRERHEDRVAGGRQDGSRPSAGAGNRRVEQQRQEDAGRREQPLMMEKTQRAQQPQRQIRQNYQVRKGEPDRDARNRENVERGRGPDHQNRQGHSQTPQEHARAGTAGTKGGADSAAKPRAHGHRDSAKKGDGGGATGQRSGGVRGDGGGRGGGRG